MLGHDARIDPADIVALTIGSELHRTAHQFVHHEAAGFGPEEKRHPRRRLQPALVQTSPSGDLRLDQAKEIRLGEKRCGTVAAIKMVKMQGGVFGSVSDSEKLVDALP